MEFDNNFFLVLILITIAISFLSTLITLVDQKSKSKEIVDEIVATMDDVSKGVNKTVGEVLRNIAESFARVMKVVWVISTTVANFFVAKLNFIIWFVSKFIYVVLFAALLFTTRFLVQGIQHPDKLDYAVGMSGLIVAAVTVFSILVAYYEFASKRKK